MNGLRRLPWRELLTFLVVGGSGYVVDLVVFNELLSVPPFATWDPSIARVVAMGVAMVVTFAGNASLTWSDRRWGRREVVLFVLLNLVGLGISTLCLVVSHDLLGLTTRLDDNASANGVGLVLGTAFRFATYRLLVFRDDDADVPAAAPRRSGGGQVAGRRMTP